MREEHGWVVVAPRGEIDLLTAPEVRDALVAAPGPRVALDLRGVGFLDTSGLRVILENDRRDRRRKYGKYFVFESGEATSLGGHSPGHDV